jgi:hypothetical protein
VQANRRQDVVARNVDASFQDSGFDVDSGVALRGDKNRYDNLWQLLKPFWRDKEGNERRIGD